MKPSQRDQVVSSPKSGASEASQPWHVSLWVRVCVGAGILSVLAAYLDAIEKLEPLFRSLKGFGFLILNPPKILLALLCVMLLVAWTAAYLLKQPTGSKRDTRFRISHGLILFACLTSFYLIAIFVLPPANATIYLVHDGAKSRIRPPADLSVPRLDIKEVPLSKIRQEFSVASRPILFSTVEKPGTLLSETRSLPSNPTVFSLRQVVENSEGLFDISCCSYVDEISRFLDDRIYKASNVVVLWEREYSAAEKNLSGELARRSSSFSSTSIIFDRQNFHGVAMFTEGACVIFVGSNLGLQSLCSITRGSTNDFILLAPNWLRPEIQPSKAARPTRNICLSSAAFEQLVCSNRESWESLLSTVKDAVVSNPISLDGRLKQDLQVWAQRIERSQPVPNVTHF